MKELLNCICDIKTWLSIDLSQNLYILKNFVKNSEYMDKFMDLFKRISKYKNDVFYKRFDLAEIMVIEDMLVDVLSKSYNSDEDNIDIDMEYKSWESFKSLIKDISAFSDEYIILATAPISDLNDSIKHINFLIDKQFETFNPIRDVILINDVPMNKIRFSINKDKIHWIKLYDKSADIHNNYISICEIINKIEYQIKSK